MFGALEEVVEGAGGELDIGFEDVSAVGADKGPGFGDVVGGAEGDA